MKQLVETVSGSSDEDTKRLVWRETVTTIDNQAAYFTEVSEEDIKSLLQNIRQQSDNMYENTKYPAVQTEIEELRQKIEKVEERIGSAKNEQNGGQT